MDNERLRKALGPACVAGSRLPGFYIGGFCPYGRENCAGGLCRVSLAVLGRGSGVRRQRLPGCRFVADRGLRQQRVGHRQARHRRLRSRRVQARRGRRRSSSPSTPRRSRSARSRSAASASAARSRAPSTGPRSPPSATPSARSTARTARLRRRTACRRASPPSRRRVRRSSSARTSSRTTPARSCTSRRTTRPSVRVTGSNNQFTGPTLQMAFAGADGVYTPAAAAMPRFIDTDPTPDEYLYNRQLIRLTGAAAEHPGRPDDGPRRRQHGLRGHLQGHRVGGPRPCRRTSRATSRASSTATRTRPRTARSSTSWPPTSRTWSRRSTCRT